LTLKSNHSASLALMLALMLAWPLAGRSATPKGPAEITIAVPSAVIAEIVRQSLPLELNTDRRLTGSLKLVAVENLALGNNQASFTFKLDGRNVGYKATVGGQPLQMTLGNLLLSLRCDAGLRFDRGRHALMVRPVIRDSGAAAGGAEILPLLGLDGRAELPIPLEKLDPFVTRIADQPLTVRLEVAGVSTVPGELRIAVRPSVSR
jgi:hypothetical protein